MSHAIFFLRKDRPRSCTPSTNEPSTRRRPPSNDTSLPRWWMRFSSKYGMHFAGARYVDRLTHE